MSEIEEADNISDVNNTREAENISDVKNTRDAVHKIQIQILKILNKCPLETRVMFGDESQYTIKITILDETKQLVTKPTGGGRGSRERRRRRRQQQRIQQQQSQQHEQQQQLQQAEPAHDIYEQQQPLQQTELIETIITVEELDISEYNLAAVEQNSSPTYQARILAPHSGPDQRQLLLQPRIPNIPTGRTRPETVAARQESNDNQQHLMQLLQEKMQDMVAEINSVKEENKNMIKDMEQLRCRVKWIREVKDKPVFCFHCNTYSNAVHYCEQQNLWINCDRFNRVTIYAVEDSGATPKNGQTNGYFQVCPMKKFTIDNREEILIKRKIKEVEREKQEKEHQDAQDLFWMMEERFGEFHFNSVQSCETFAWGDRETFCGQQDNYPQKKLPKDQEIRFEKLRRDETIKGKYNDIKEKKKQFQEQRNKQLEQKREQERRQRRDMEPRSTYIY